MTAVPVLLLVLLVAAVAFAVNLWTQQKKVSREIESLRAAIRERDGTLAKVTGDAKTRAEELDAMRKQLHDAKAKLGRREKDRNSKKKGHAPSAPEPESSVAHVVHVSNEELEARHRRRVGELEIQLLEAQTRMEQLEARAAERRTELNAAIEAAEVASRAPIEVASSAPPTPGTRDTPPSSAETEERVAALETRLRAVERAARERENALVRELDDAQQRARAALKRAASSHSLYQVIRGHLELTEDKLAMLRRKYEGAKSPSELERAAARRASVRADRPDDASTAAGHEDPPAPPVEEIATPC